MVVFLPVLSLTFNRLYPSPPWGHCSCRPLDPKPTEPSHTSTPLYLHVHQVAFYIVRVFITIIVVLIKCFCCVGCNLSAKLNSKLPI